MKEANRELSRLEGIPSASPEYGVIRTYVQILPELPWSVATEDKIDMAEAALLSRQTLRTGLTSCRTQDRVRCPVRHRFHCRWKSQPSPVPDAARSGYRVS